jgi:hypothetical protein
MNKNGWLYFVTNTILLHIILSGSSITRYESIRGLVLVILGEIAVSYYLTGYMHDIIKREHFKHIDNPHWSHMPYQRFFEDEDLKLF